MSKSFDVGFTKLKSQLDDPGAQFWGEGMRDDLLALVSDISGPHQEACLFRELAILEAKRDEVICLDHADRALAAQDKCDALTPKSLYWMHLSCGDTGSAWDNGPRTRMHLDRALALHKDLNMPLEQEFAIRKRLGIFGKVTGQDRDGLDWLEPLLADGEAFYGSQSAELCDLLSLMSDIYEKQGQMAQAVIFHKRSITLRDPLADPGRMVSAYTAHGALLQRAGLHYDAKAAFEKAIAQADAHCSKSTQGFARERFLKCYPDAQVSS